LNGHYTIVDYTKDAAKKDSTELRVCIEIATDEKKWEWREQIMMLADATTGKFSPKVKVLDKWNVDPDLLKVHSTFCAKSVLD